MPASLAQAVFAAAAAGAVPFHEAAATLTTTRLGTPSDAALSALPRLASAAEAGEWKQTCEAASKLVGDASIPAEVLAGVARALVSPAWLRLATTSREPVPAPPRQNAYQYYGRPSPAPVPAPAPVPSTAALNAVMAALRVCASASADADLCQHKAQAAAIASDFVAALVAPPADAAARADHRRFVIAVAERANSAAEGDVARSFAAPLARGAIACGGNDFAAYAKVLDANSFAEAVCKRAAAATSISAAWELYKGMRGGSIGDGVAATVLGRCWELLGTAKVKFALSFACGPGSALPGRGACDLAAVAASVVDLSVPGNAHELARLADAAGARARRDSVLGHLARRAAGVVRERAASKAALDAAATMRLLQLPSAIAATGRRKEYGSWLASFCANPCTNMVTVGVPLDAFEPVLLAACHYVCTNAGGSHVRATAGGPLRSLKGSTVKNSVTLRKVDVAGRLLAVVSAKRALQDRELLRSLERVEARPNAEKKRPSTPAEAAPDDEDGGPPPAKRANL